MEIEMEQKNNIALHNTNLSNSKTNGFRFV